MSSDAADLARAIARVERAVDAEKRQMIAAATDTAANIRGLVGGFGGTALAFVLSAFVGALLVGPRKTGRRRR